MSPPCEKSRGGEKRSTKSSRSRSLPAFYGAAALVSRKKFAARNYPKRSHLFPGRGGERKKETKKKNRLDIPYAIRAIAHSQSCNHHRGVRSAARCRSGRAHLEILSCRATIALGVTFSFSCTASPHLMLSTTPAVPLSSRSSGSR